MFGLYVLVLMSTGVDTPISLGIRAFISAMHFHSSDTLLRRSSSFSFLIFTFLWCLCSFILMTEESVKSSCCPISFSNFSFHVVICWRSCPWSVLSFCTLILIPKSVSNMVCTEIHMLFHIPNFLPRKYFVRFISATLSSDIFWWSFVSIASFVVTLIYAIRTLCSHWNNIQPACNNVCL